MPTEMTIAEIESAGEKDLGASDWHVVTQEHVDQFAEATGDHQWIHVNPEMATQGPFGGTVAHGYLSLSLLPMLLGQVLAVTDARMGVNYGTDKVRFTSPVPTGSEVRAKAKLLSAQRKGDGLLYKLAVELEIKGQDKPAMVGEVLYMIF